MATTSQSNLEGAIQALLQRLQTVTTRLETVEKQLASHATAGAAGAPPAAPAAAAGSAAAFDASSVASVVDFDELVHATIDVYVEHSKKLGDLVAKQAELVKKAVDQQRGLLVVAAQAKKPSADQVAKLLEPIGATIKEIVDLREKSRQSPQLNHLATVSEGIGALGWVQVSPTPGPYVGEARSASEFYSNRVLKDWKGKAGGEVHVDWVNAWHSFLVQLQPYVKKHHTTELSWTGQGEALQLAGGPKRGPPPPPMPGMGGPPPPPPPSHGPHATSPASGGADAAKGAPADPTKLFAAINQGEGVTKALKHVTNNMKTKNRPAEERVSVVKAEEGKSGGASGRDSSKGTKGGKERPPKLALEGSKWVVEYQVGQKSLVIGETEPRQTVYIYRVKDSVVTVKGKVNNITLDECHGTGVVFDNAIASVEVVNSSGIQVQVLGKVPSFAVDKTSGLQLYLSKDCLQCELVTSKSDSMNVMLPPEKEGDDGTELPVPEQYKTVIKNRKLVTDIVRHE